MSVLFLSADCFTSIYFIACFPWGNVLCVGTSEHKMNSKGQPCLHVLLSAGCARSTISEYLYFSPVLCEIEDISSQTKAHAGFLVFDIISYSVGSWVYVNNMVFLPSI